MSIQASALTVREHSVDEVTVVIDRCDDPDSRLTLKKLVRELLLVGKTSFEFRFLAGCKFDSMFLGALISTGKNIKQMGGNIRLSMSEELYEQFFSLHLHDVFPITRAPS